MFRRNEHSAESTDSPLYSRSEVEIYAPELTPTVRMTSRSKEKVASVFHRLFRSSREKSKDVEVERSGQTHQGSPSRRLLRGHGVVSPAELGGGGEPGGAAGAGLQQQQQQPPGGGTPGGGKLASFFKRKPQQPATQSSPSGEIGVAEMGLGKSVRTRRLMKELNDIQKSQNKDSPFSVELINDNLYDWHIRLYSIDSESELAGDMREIGLRHISLQLTFPENFPFVPPFMRVIAPRIEKGFVMEGGAICMELLTPRGWASAYTVEAIVMQFAASIVKGQGRISKKGKASAHKEFNRRSAEESFRSLVKTHDKYGWVTPPLADG